MQPVTSREISSVACGVKMVGHHCYIVLFNRDFLLSDLKRL